MKRIYTLLFFIVFTCSAIAQTLQSPAEFLGYQLGSQFTFHHRIAEYFKYVAQTTKNVKLVSYGTTPEGRPLMVAFIGSAENMNRLEDIRQHNLYLAGLSNGPATLSNAPAIVWLSYNVHGNEPSSSEVAMQTLYDMANPANSRTQVWLKNTLVVIDPCLNPDGRERYVDFYNQARGVQPNANPSSREHMEPWPGGRVNHYYFDLNRDWAWQTQTEVQGRVGLFNRWLPEVHVDFHEQGYNAPYYFAPAAEPFHKDITPWQREFQTTIGKNNAKYFDQNGWLYFTKEEFDLLYPSYGDTYPIYNGSIGMTYEQGGIGAGLAIQTRNGDTLTLADRIAHHYSNALSTVEVTSAHAQKVLAEFKKFYDNSRTNPPGPYKTYIIKNENPDKLRALAQLLDRNRIQYEFGVNRKARGYNYFSGQTESFEVNAGDMVINAYQPKAVLMHVLMEPKTLVTDSNTYDITAWSLPYVYGLKAYGVSESIKPGSIAKTPVTVAPPPPEHAYAYVSNWQSVQDVKFLAALLSKNIRVRYASAAFTANGKSYNPGSLIITKADNSNPDFDQVVMQAAHDCSRTLVPLTTGFVDKGADLGSGVVHYLQKPRIMLMTGDGVNAEAMGEVWHYFEKEVGYPVTLVRYHDLYRVRMADFDLAIVPDGNYEDFPSERLQNWVRDGGKLIAMGDAVGQLADRKGFALKKKEDPKDSKPGSKPAELRPYENRERDAIRYNVPGAIFKLNLDNTHPLGYGYPKFYYTLRLSSDVYDYLGDDGWSVGTLKKGGYTSGFVGQKAKDKLSSGLVFGVQPLGRGSVVYLADDPLFRSFWENGKLLFGNAVFMVQ
ncbi:zinc carboxypeptidase [Mucilaginibacter robiniae]|uniref:Zinc carboxypeptidase n=1 Tax=Mucilaginibacter robiniae TaxID=2728022 RepID=A0A7L5E1C6_9SPHI|nr:M14 family metallopeptidase [Mucilaginibacter robiniae]QJD96308.1 zinc carboxypeptidase [Mucilaginibacter robiniae]